MQEMVAINIVIGDRTYRIKIDPKDEEVVRKAVKVINDKVIEFKTQFSGKDMQDYVAMVLMWFATEQNAAVVQELEKDHIAGQLQSIERMLENQLK